MGSVLPVPANATLYRIRRIQAITIAWMSAEAVVSLSAARMAHSPAMLAFGGDSAIELLSAVVVYWRFRSKSNGDQIERLAARNYGLPSIHVGGVRSACRRTSAAWPS
jgi:hypothetical protein